MPLVTVDLPVFDGGTLEGMREFDSCCPGTFYSSGPLSILTISRDSTESTFESYLGFAIPIPPTSEIVAATLDIYQFFSSNGCKFYLPYDEDFLVDPDSPETIFSFLDTADTPNEIADITLSSLTLQSYDVKPELTNFINASNYKTGGKAIFYGFPDPQPPSNSNRFYGSLGTTSPNPSLHLEFEVSVPGFRSMIHGIHMAGV